MQAITLDDIALEEKRTIERVQRDKFGGGIITREPQAFAALAPLTEGFAVGDRVMVKPSSKISLRGKTGTIEKKIPTNKAYVKFGGERRLVDLDDLERAKTEGKGIYLRAATKEEVGELRTFVRGLLGRSTNVSVKMINKKTTDVYGPYPEGFTVEQIGKIAKWLLEHGWMDLYDPDYLNRLNRKPYATRHIGNFMKRVTEDMSEGIDPQGPGENKPGDTDVQPAKGGKFNVFLNKAGKWVKVAGPFDDMDKAVKEAERIEKAGKSKTESRFDKLAGKLGKRGDVTDPKALAAYIGRKKYGKGKFQKMAAAGKKEGLEALALDALLPERKMTGDYGRGAGGRSSEMSWQKGPKPSKGDKKAASRGERRGKKGHIAAQMRGEGLEALALDALLESDVPVEGAEAFSKRLKAYLEKIGKVTDYKLRPGGNVNSFIDGKLDGKAFEIEIRAKRKYERPGSPMFLSALKINGDWMRGAAVKNAATMIKQKLGIKDAA